MQRNLGVKIDKSRTRMSARAGERLPDVCSFYKPEGAATVSLDAFGESTTDEQAGAASVRCRYWALSAHEKQAGGAVTANASHGLELQHNTDTAAIAADQRLVVAPRGDTGALGFQVTGRLDSSTDSFLHLAATLRS